MNNTTTKLQEELQSFQGIWKGGYYEGNPLNSLSSSTYFPQGFMSVLHVIYLVCIKPYVKEGTKVIEIGCGRGAWTKTFTHAQEVWCLDALSAEHNNFWEYVGQDERIHYFQVNDFSCNMLPENHFDYLFTFGALCHISFEGITAYMKNIYPKFKAGANAFIMVADYEKYNRCLDLMPDYINIFSSIEQNMRREPGRLQRLLGRLVQPHYKTFGKKANINEDANPTPGRWYHAGIDRTCAMLKDIGYEVISEDVGASPRDPIIHFKKPM